MRPRSLTKLLLFSIAGGDDQYNNNNGGADFDCYDQAEYVWMSELSKTVSVNTPLTACLLCQRSYTNVNQCMKFMAKTEMQTATFRDMAAASSQGTLVDSPLAGYRHKVRATPGTTTTYLYLSFSTFILVFGIFRFLKARRQHNFAPNWSPKQPLIFA
jgi:hypothetical protein